MSSLTDSINIKFYNQFTDEFNSSIIIDKKYTTKVSVNKLTVNLLTKFILSLILTY